MATLTVDSIRNQDFPVVQCAVILLALIIVAVNLVVDMVVGFIDPRDPGGRMSRGAGRRRGAGERRAEPRRDRRPPSARCGALAAEVGAGRRLVLLL